MIKIAVNKCYGGFGLSNAAIKRYWELKGRPCYFYKYNYKKGKATYLRLSEQDIDSEWRCLTFDLATIEEVEEALASGRYEEHSLYLGGREDMWRADPHLIQVIEEMGEAANGTHAEIEIVNIPCDVRGWTIEGYDGHEWVAEKHRRW